MLNALSLLVGVALLYGGGETLVRGAAHLARSLGLSSLVIGLTVVAFGTSSPELASSLIAALQGSPDVALGNVLGSNIANIGLILGLSALLRPVLAQSRVVFRELPFMVLTGVLLIPLAWNGRFGRLDGILMLAIFVTYIWILFRTGEAPPGETEELLREGQQRRGVSVTLVVAGILLLTLGAKLLVTGAVGIARGMGLSEQLIGLTLVALGTSLPELATSLVAASKDEGDLVLGNVIGSNIFNVLFVLALTVIVVPIPVLLSTYGRDLVVALAFAIAPILFLLRHRRLDRWEGAVLLTGYAAYIVYLFQ